MKRISTNISHAVDLLNSGGVVAIPTETVYGLAADARCVDSIKKIFQIKGRPSDHPLIVHIANAASLDEWAKEIPESAYRLAAAFWPGPLTLILQKKEHVLSEITAGLDTVALRVPNHPLTLELLEKFGGALAAPSANLYTRVSPTSAEDVADELGEKVDLIIDGGRCLVGIESTIVDLSDTSPKILRPGVITQEQIYEVLGKQETKNTPKKSAAKIKHPGDKLSHYSPKANLILCSEENFHELLEEWQDRSSRVGVLSSKVPQNRDQHLTWFAFGQESTTQAQRLYSSLRQADKLGVEVLLVLLPKNSGIGVAIHDRLRRAAHKSTTLL